VRTNSATGGRAGDRIGVSGEVGFASSKRGGAGQGGAIYTLGMLAMSGGALNDNQAIGGQSGNISGEASFLYGSSGGDGSGGALSVPAGSAELTGVQIQRNIIVGGAGGSSPTSTGPAGDGYGGAIYASAPLTISGGVISDNSVPDSDYGGGGALMIEGGATTIDSASFVRNSSPSGYGGGALLVTSSTMTITASLFNNNTASTGGAIAAGGEGGPIAIQIQNSMFISNTAEYEGGAASLFGDIFMISGSTFANNQSTDVEGGGGAITSQGSLTISNSTISGNRSRGSGGGLFVRDGDASLDHVTISANTADSAGTDSGEGGGLDSNGTTTMANTIVAGNFDTPSNSGGETIMPDVSGNITSGGYNLIGDGTGSSFTNGANGDQVGTATSRLDPLLGPLQTNGGPTFTRALLPGSPAIDAGDPAFAPPPSSDQRGAGFSRIGDGRTDIGAFEVQSAARPIYSSAPTVPGPITISGPAGILASTSISVTNIGDPLTSLSVLTATASTGFSVTPPLPSALQPGDLPQQLVVTCTPSASGPQTGTLVVTTNEPESPSYTYILSCAALIPGIVLTPNPLDFGDQPINTTSAVRLVTLSSSGAAPLQVDSIAISGDFAIVASGSPAACPASPPPFTLAPGSSCTIGVSFTPSATGPRGGTLTVAGNASGSPHSVALSGVGVPNTSQTTRRLFLPIVLIGGQADLAITSLSISPSKQNYTAGESVQISVTVTNQGNAPTTSAFWVDLYVNPARPPAVNTLWSDVCDISPCVGVAWPVLSSLAPGQSITLTATRASYDQDRSFWLGWLPSGTTEIYALADSWNTSGNRGTINESDEANNLAHIDGLTVTGTNPPYEPWPGMARPHASAPGALPARPLPYHK
jgi:predicted outer membrane repeat protein